MRPKAALTWFITIALAAALLWLSLRGVDWSRVGASLTHARMDALAMACLGASVVLILRSERWRILLRAEGAISARLVFWSTSLGYLGNNVLPARMGELLRMRAVASKTGLSNSYVLATALTERALDAGVLVLVSCCAMLAASALPEWIRGAAASMAVVSGATLGGILLLPKCEVWLQAAIGRLPCKPGLRSRILGLVSNFLLGMRSFHHAGRAARFLALTAVVWVIDGFSAMFVAQAISVRLSLAEALLVVAALALSSALPSTPGALGVYQFVAVTVMAPIGISNNDALAFVFLYQGIVVCTLAFWGLMGAWRLRSRRAGVEATGAASVQPLAVASRPAEGVERG
ncbi:MAG TPA: lysylphosphatidylglycerol synthase transmembrane domain-containing protein [Bryobacteraceae bacterium]|nr:lysylphosphatidylglycerol synthase transmembrane domain-containing protein [Bryobacteraceae bacterium]